MDNIIILDLDGVLITSPSWESDNLHEDGYSDFNLNCVNNLNKIIKDTGYDIVLSSSRRLKVDIYKMNEYFRNRGVSKEIIAYIPDYNVDDERKLNRREEIEIFLETYQPKNYLILDDDKSLSGANEEIKSNWIQTYLMTGL